MRKLFFFLLLTWVLPFELSGENLVDSLLQKVDDLKGEEKVKTCLDLVNALRYTNQEKAKKYGLEGLKIAKDLELAGLESDLLLSIGIIHALQANYQESISFYEKALIGYKKLENAKGIGKSLNALGRTQRWLGNFQEAATSFEKAIFLFQTLGDTSEVLLIKGNLANLEFSKGNYDAALAVYQDILDWAIQTNNPALIASQYGNIGRVYSFKGDYPASLSSYYKALPIMDSLNNRTATLKIYNSIGILFMDMEMYDLATENFENGLLLDDSTGNDRPIGAINANLSQLFIHQKDYKQAYFHIQKALKIYEDKGIKSKGNLLQNLASIYRERMQFDSAAIILEQVMEIGRSFEQKQILANANANFASLHLKQNKITKAKAYLLRAEALYEELGNVKGQFLVLEEISEMADSIITPEDRIRYKEKYFVLKDSLFGLEKMNEVIRLEMERTQEVFLERQSEKKSKTSPHYSSLWYLGILTLFSLFGFGWWWTKRRKEKDLQRIISRVSAENKTIQESLEKKKLEMTFLSLDMAQKDVFLKNLKMELEKFSQKFPINQEVQQLVRSIHLQDTEKKDWEIFKHSYEEVFPNFFDNLLQDYSSLSGRELRHCALIRLKIPLSEIADILGISVNSVHKARHRLRTKFQLERGQKLESFILKY